VPYHIDATVVDVAIRQTQRSTQRWVLGMAAPQINTPHRKQLTHAAVIAMHPCFVVDALQQRLQPCRISS
jgi:hypothetical protein